MATFDTWKYENSFANPAGSLNNFNFDRYARTAAPSAISPLNPNSMPLSPEVRARLTQELEALRNRGGGTMHQDGGAPGSRGGMGLHRGWGRAGGAVARHAVPRRPAHRGLSLSGLNPALGFGGGGGGGQDWTRMTPGVQTTGIYPQTGSQQDYSLHNPNSWTYQPTNY
jgi:hypothetical protein